MPEDAAAASETIDAEMRAARERAELEEKLAAKEAEAGEVLPTPSPPDERLAG